MAPSDWGQSLREVDEVTGIAGIARRYLAMNAFDGVVTVLGVVTGTWAAGVTDPRVVLTTGVATSVAMGISGLWGAYLTEGAEREREVGELEDQLLTDLQQTRIGRASRKAVWIVTAVDGGSPLVAGLLVISPFVAAPLLPDLIIAYSAAVTIAALELVALGWFLGKVSRGRPWVYVAKTLTAGIMALLVGLALHGL